MLSPFRSDEPAATDLPSFSTSRWHPLRLSQSLARPLCKEARPRTTTLGNQFSWTTEMSALFSRGRCDAAAAASTYLDVVKTRSHLGISTLSNRQISTDRSNYRFNRMPFEHDVSLIARELLLPKIIHCLRSCFDNNVRWVDFHSVSGMVPSSAKIVNL